MAAYEIHLTIKAGHDLKNVNWRNGDLQPYVVVWIDPAAKYSTRVAAAGDDDDPIWDERLVLPLPPTHPLDGAALYLDVVHVGAAEGVKPLVGSARLPLCEVLDECGIGEAVAKKLKLKRPSGRPQGKLEILVGVREPAYRYANPPSAQYGYSQPQYGTPPYAQPPTGYPYGGPPAERYDYGAPATSTAAYGYGEEKKKSGMGMGTGLAVGAAAGLVGGLALAEGVDYVEDKIADDVAERVEEDEFEQEFDDE